ncbi:MAG: hypothetical protein MZW92_75510 [Comamonadaceae bacterium]|nr:hypothetical protein [Comamonadaceae bacterium]
MLDGLLARHRAGRDRGAGGPVGRRQEHRLPVAAAVLRRRSADASASTASTSAALRAGRPARGASRVVPQDAVIFSGTVLRQHPLRPPGRERQTRAARRRARRLRRRVRRAACPTATRTFVGERGAAAVRRPAPAHRHRARDAARTPPLLLLDEATSALDAESERAGAGRARRPRCAAAPTIVIAHRLATVQRGRPHRGARSRRHPGGRDARGTGPDERALRPARRAPVRCGRRRKRRRRGGRGMRLRRLLLVAALLSACSAPKRGAAASGGGGAGARRFHHFRLRRGQGPGVAGTAGAALRLGRGEWRSQRRQECGDALARLPGLLDEHGPALLLVEIGGNDMLRKLPQAETVSNLERILDLARQRGVRTALMAIPRPSVAGAVFASLSPAGFYREVAERHEHPAAGGRGERSPVAARVHARPAASERGRPRRTGGKVCRRACARSGCCAEPRPNSAAVSAGRTPPYRSAPAWPTSGHSTAPDPMTQATPSAKNQ